MIDVVVLFFLAFRFVAFGKIAHPTVATGEIRQVCGTCVEQPLGGNGRSTRLWLNESTIAQDLHGDRWSLGFLLIAT